MWARSSYIDKDLTPVRARLRRLLLELSADPRVQLQVIVVTHSRNVMDEADYFIALKDGCNFSRGTPHSGGLVLSQQLNIYL